MAAAFLSLAVAAEEPVSAGGRRAFVDAVLTLDTTELCGAEFREEQAAWAREDGPVYSSDDDYYEDEDAEAGPKPEDVQASRECQSEAVSLLLEFAVGDAGLAAAMETEEGGDKCVVVAREIIAATRGEREQPAAVPECDNAMFTALHAAVAKLSRPAAEGRVAAEAEAAAEEGAESALRAWLKRKGLLAAATPLAKAGVRSLDDLDAMAARGALPQTQLTGFLMSRLRAAVEARSGGGEEL
uniref:Uncharacterized protein n=1 Tax=Bicosoecida sp. CB-2014 TaxID=1486930 RepID=A0A7S1G5M1_9STRA